MPEAAAWIRPLAWDLPYAAGAALKKKKNLNANETKHQTWKCSRHQQSQLSPEVPGPLCSNTLCDAASWDYMLGTVPLLLPSSLALDPWLLT